MHIAKDVESKTMVGGYMTIFIILFIVSIVARNGLKMVNNVNPYVLSINVPIDNERDVISSVKVPLNSTTKFWL